MQGTGGLTKQGTGKLTLTAASTCTGATSVEAGTLDLGNSGRLTATSSVTINSGGTLVRSGLEGLNETVGALTLSATSTIDFGTGTGTQRLSFADSHHKNWSGILNIWNWTRGVDHLVFGTSSSSLTASQLSAINFYSDSGMTPLRLQAAFTGSLGEVVPVPEPSSVALALGLFALSAGRECRRRRRPGKGVSAVDDC